MNNKLPMAFRTIFSVALLIIFAGLLTTTTVQSADPNSPNVNAPPVLDPIGPQTVDELIELTFTATATDPESDPLTFSLGSSAPSSATIGSSSGVFSWTPGEDEGPDTPSFDVCVSDGSQQDCETITVTVNEVNVPPTLNPIGPKTIDELTLLSFTATASDTDLPPNLLTFSLGAGFPTGASITSGGLFSWTPTEAQGPGIYPVTVRVTDDGSPLLDDFETINITVNDSPVVNFNTAAQSQSEGMSSMLIFAQLNKISSLPITVPFTVTGTATPIDDYTILPANQVIIPAGNLSATITITVVDDLIDEINETVIVTMGIPTNANQGITNISIATILDNDTAGLTVVTTPPMQTTEVGGTASFTVALSSQPTANVTVTLTSNTPTEGIVTFPLTPTLTFTTSDWSTPQPVIVTGVDDFVMDGNTPYSIVLDPDSVGDTKYGTLLDVLVAVTNIDNDTAGLTVVPTPPMQTTESGGTASFTVALSSVPLDTVTVAVTSDTPTEGIVTFPLTPTLTFTTIDWSTPQLVIITGVDDFVVDGDILYNIVLDPASLGDLTYNALPNVNVGVTNLDDDVFGFTFTPPSGLLTSESGLPTATFDVILNTIPTADVTLALSSSDLTEGTIDKPSLTFTNLDWNVPQTVTITGVDDSVADGDQLYAIVTGPVTTTDLDYAALDPVLDIPDVSVTNSDNDTPGYTIIPDFDLWTSEAGAIVKVQILLKTKPTHKVRLKFTSSNITEGTVSPASILVDPAVWPPTTPSEITITGVDDCKNNGDEAYTVTITATSSDPNYNGPVEVLHVTNYDAPNIAWVKPVVDEKRYYSDGVSPIPLEVVNLCNEPISRVRFYRWVVAIMGWVTIGEDLTPPYQEILLPGELEPGDNQIFAVAFGLPNPVQNIAIRKRILIYMDFGNQIHLPLVYKQP